LFERISNVRTRCIFLSELIIGGTLEFQPTLPFFLWARASENILPKKNEHVFRRGNLRWFRQSLVFLRKRLAYKLQNPRFREVKFHTFRHWKATMEYAKTKDILYVKQLLGHKSIENTLRYTQLVNFETDEYTSRVAKTVEEACELIDAGFDFVCKMDSVQIFRKRK